MWTQMHRRKPPCGDGGCHKPRNAKVAGNHEGLEEARKHPPLEPLRGTRVGDFDLLPSRTTRGYISTFLKPSRKPVTEITGE